MSTWFVTRSSTSLFPMMIREHEGAGPPVLTQGTLAQSIARPTSERPLHILNRPLGLHKPVWLKGAEAVSKLEIIWFSGVALPFPKCREADTEHSGGSTFAPDVDVARFDTTSVGFCRSRQTRRKRFMLVSSRGRPYRPANLCIATRLRHSNQICNRPLIERERHEAISHDASTPSQNA